MARMLPNQLDRESTSPAEQKVFEGLSGAAGTEAWWGLHQLYLPRHDRQVCGEIDFVVLAPRLGVLCLEVKGVRQVRREGGVWYLGRQDGEARGPFRQASDGKSSLFERVRRGNPSAVEGVPWWHAVCFTDVEFTIEPVSDEWNDWEVIDARFLVKHGSLERGLVEGTKRALHCAGELLRARGVRIAPGDFSEERCGQLARLLRPDFEYSMSVRTRNELADAEVRRYTEDQFQALDQLADNPRTLFRGSAGTGKTFLAMEAARRARAEGRKVLLVCYNRAFGEWLGGQVRDLGPEVEALTVHALMARIARSRGHEVPRDPAPEYWEEELPQQALDAVLDGAVDRQYDTLIVDEAQDLAKEQPMAVLDLLLDGGIGGGTWAMFGDFGPQNLFGGLSLQGMRDLLDKSFGASHVVCALQTNCRNTRPIAAVAQQLGATYRVVRRQDAANAPEVIRYATREDQARRLEGCLDSLWDYGYRGTHMVVLSLRRESAVVHQIAADPWRQRLVPYAPGLSKQQVPYTTVHAYKGLETHQVVITDLEPPITERELQLLYTGITRAVHGCTLLIHRDAVPEIVGRLTRQ